MLLIPCPFCGLRAEVEFRYGGEAHMVRAIDGSDDDWGGYLYARTNTRGPHAERWRHIHGCGQFFNVVRDTLSDAITQTYPATAGRPPWPGAEAGVASGDAV